MISEKLIAVLKRYPYDPQAETQVNYIPIGGIYWQDEYPTPKDRSKLDEDATGQLLYLYRLRFKVWRDEPLTDEERHFWTTAESALPNWGFFKRLSLSSEEQAIQAELEEEFCDFAAMSSEEAEDFQTSTDQYGNQSFSITFDLTGEKPQLPWWKRIIGRS